MYFAFKYIRRSRTTVQLNIYFRKVYDSVKREVSYNVLIVYSIPMKLVRLVNMFLNEACSDVLTGKYLYDEFQTRRLFATRAYKLCWRVWYEVGPSKQ